MRFSQNDPLTLAETQTSFVPLLFGKKLEYFEQNKLWRFMALCSAIFLFSAFKKKKVLALCGGTWRFFFEKQNYLFKKLAGALRGLCGANILKKCKNLLFQKTRCGAMWR